MVYAIFLYPKNLLGHDDNIGGGVNPSFIWLTFTSYSRGKVIGNEITGIETVSYEEIFPRNFGVGGVKNFLGKKNRFLACRMVVVRGKSWIGLF